MLKNKKGFIAVELLAVGFVLLIVLVAGVGYIKHIIKLTQCDFEAPYKAEAIRLVGLFPVVGAITGWIDFGK